MQEDDVDCQGDEYPPAVVWQGRANKNGAGQQWIRQLPGSQNEGAGSLFKGVCPEDADIKNHLTNLKVTAVQKQGCRVTTHYTVTQVLTWPALSLDFINMPVYANDKDGLTTNPCWPSSLEDDPGFALLLTDPWYLSDPGLQGYGLLNYDKPPANSVTAGKIIRPDWNKRALFGDGFDPDDVIVDEGNSTRKATDEELARHLGFRRCAEKDCAAEKEAMGMESAMVRGVPNTSPVLVMASTTSAEVDGTLTPTLASSRSEGRVVPDMPWITGMPSLEELRRDVSL